MFVGLTSCACGIGLWYLIYFFFYPGKSLISVNGALPEGPAIVLPQQLLGYPFAPGEWQKWIKGFGGGGGGLQNSEEHAHKTKERTVAPFSSKFWRETFVGGCVLKVFHFDLTMRIFLAPSTRRLHLTTRLSLLLPPSSLSYSFPPLSLTPTLSLKGPPLTPFFF